MGRLISAFFIMIAFGLEVKSQDPNFHIYLCFGQSNMEGNGSIEAQDLSGVNSRFQVMGAVNCNSGSKSYTIGKWQTATPAIVRCNTGLGPADYFGRTLVSGLPQNIKIGVVPVAIGGCDIALFDKVNYASYVATAPSWMISTINQYGGNPYARLVEIAKLAQKDGVIKGILLHQGETNNGQSTWPSKVKAIYDNLVNDLGLDPKKTPLLAGETVTTEQGGACGAHNAVLAKLPSVLPNSYIISASGLPHKGDNLHFTSASYRTLGQRYAQKMLSLLVLNNPPSVSVSSPLNNAVYESGKNVEILASAFDEDGNINKVEFFEGANKLGEDNSTPYTFTWVKPIQGAYGLTAIATDNSGGKTTSPAVNIKVGIPVVNLVANGEFDNGTNSWILQMNNSANGNISIAENAGLSGSNSIKICPTTPGSADWHVQLQQTIPVVSGKTYMLGYFAKSDVQRTISVGIQQSVSPYAMYHSQTISINSTSQWYSQTFTATANDETSQLKFFVGNNSNCVYIDKVEVTEVPVVLGETDGISQQHNVCIFPNPSGEVFQVTLKGRFDYKILGNTGNVLEKGVAVDKVILGKQLPKGIYLLQLNHENKEFCEKIVKSD